MAKYLAYIDPKDIERFEIYDDRCKHTAGTLKNLLGCDHIINGGLFNMSNGAPVCQLKIGGVVKANDTYNYYGFAWNTAADAQMMVIPRDYAGFKNAIACVALRVKGRRMDYEIQQATKNAGLGYQANRTAIGLKDGKIAMCIANTTMTPVMLYDYLTGEGWSDILMLDGGGSTQGTVDGKTITSSRKCSNFICIWLKKKTGATTGTSSNTNPYTMPTTTLKQGSTGTGVKWAQWQLRNVFKYATIEIDGAFGPKMLAAVKDFQKRNALDVDGLIGPATRTCMKTSASKGYEEEKPAATPVQTPTATPTVTGDYTNSSVNAQIIWDYLIAKIGNPYGVAGLMGNIFAESGLLPNNVQNSYEKTVGDDATYTSKVDSGKYSRDKFMNDKAGYGLCQWTYCTRKAALYDFAKKANKSIGDLYMQLDFLWEELTTKYAKVVTVLKSAVSVQQASNAVVVDFEAPAGYNTPDVQNKRASFGQVYFDKFAKSGNTAATPNPTTPQYVTAKNPYAKPIVTLKKGSTGTGVKWLQYQLNVHGFPCDVDGAFGNGTLTQVKAFQTKKKLEVDGLVGPATRAELAK